MPTTRCLSEMQRYAKLPVIEPSFSAATCVAFDLMSVNLADLPALPRLLPALQLPSGSHFDTARPYQEDPGINAFSLGSASCCRCDVQRSSQRVADNAVFNMSTG